MKELEKTIHLAADSDFFDGHFPSFKLMPAVAQLDLVAKLASEAFALPCAVKKIKRIKFTEKILPETDVLVSIKLEEEPAEEGRKVSFTIKSADKCRTYASGSYTA